MKTWVVAAAALGLLACSSDVAELSMEEPEERLLHAPGDSVKFRAIAKTRSGEMLPDVRVTWSSSNPSVASVRDGEVTAHRTGRAIITASGRNNVLTSSTVRVSIPARVEVRPGDLELFGPGSKVELKALVLDEQDQRVLRLSPECASKDAAVARVEDGNIVAMGAGRTQVTCTAGEASADVDVRVFRARPARLALSHSRHQFRSVGDQLQLTAKAFDRSSVQLEGVRVRWFSSNQDVVKVDERGLLVAVGPGRTIVTASSVSGRAGVEVVVPAPPVR